MSTGDDQDIFAGVAATGPYQPAADSTKVARVLGELTVENRMEMHLYLQRTIMSGAEAVEYGIIDSVLESRAAGAEADS